MSFERRVGLWYVRTKEVTDPRTIGAIERLLSTEERTRHRRFLFDKHRHEFLVTRGIERAVLSLCLGRAPEKLAFQRNEYGRPEVVPRSDLHFNLTNTVEMVVCGVTLARELGVDAEPLDRADTILEIVETCFTVHERAMLAGLALEARRRRAVELWTLKEAYMKARGMGMSIPVQQFELRFDRPSSPRLRFHEEVVDEPSRWWLATRQIGDHLVSVCVERTSDEPSAEVEITTEHADLAAMLTGNRSGGPDGS